MHLADGELQALADGEGQPADGSDTLRHLASCPDCWRRLQELRALEARTGGLLEALDHAPPPVTAAAVIARAGRDARRRRAVGAGVAALLLAGAAAAAIPGSPVQRYVASVLARVRQGAVGRAPAAVPEAKQEPPSGIAIGPAARAEIVFLDVQDSGVIRVTVADTGVLSITHQGGTAGYEVTDSGVAVDNAGSRASYEVTIPQRTARARILVGGQLVFAKDGVRVTTTAARDRDGSYVIDLSHLVRRLP